MMCPWTKGTVGAVAADMAGWPKASRGETGFGIAMSRLGVPQLGESIAVTIVALTLAASVDEETIANVFVQGLGVFSVSFEDRNLTGIKDKDVYIRATMTQVSAVPLPAGAWLLLSGLAVLGAARLRRRAVA